MGDFAKDMGKLAGFLVNPVVGITMLAASTGLEIAANRQAAGAQKVELDLKKREEASKFRDREIQRKRRLRAIIGSQAAEAAAKGIGMSGSVANITITDAKRAGEETLIDSVNTGARISALNRQRKTISRLSSYRTATSILGFGRDASKIDFKE